MPKVISRERNPQSPFWWEAKTPEEAAKLTVGYVRSVQEHQSYQHELNIRNARLYMNTDMLGMDWTLTERNPVRRKRGRVVENVTQSVCDTAASMIAKNRPRATFQTDGASWRIQRRAQKLEQFVEGQFALTDIYREGVKVFRDAVVFGTGCMKIYDHNGSICAERVLIDEIIVDEREARAAYPRQIHQVKLINKEVLKAMFPDRAEDIEIASIGSTEQNYMNAWSTTDPSNIWVCESWHLPSGPGYGDGKHAINVDSLNLLWEDYIEDDFPFIFYRWSEPLAGFYGQGLVEQLTGIQLRINKLNNFIQRAQDLIAVPRVFVDVATKQLKLQINNEIGAIIPYRGKPPVFMTPQAVGAEIYNYKEQLKRSAYELAGISQLSATALKPAGLESAVALREYNDIETQRFAIQAQEYEEMFLRVAKRFVRLGKKIYRGGEGEDMTSVWRTVNYAKRIKWSEVDLEETAYVMSIEAASILSRTPAGRSQQVQEWFGMGMIDKDEARKLIQHPDLPSSQELYNAMINNIDATIDKLRDGVFVPPEAFQNLALGQARVQMAYLHDKDAGAPEEVLDVERQWIEQAKFILDQLNQEQMAQAAMAQQQAMMQAAMQSQGGDVAGSGVQPTGLGPLAEMTGAMRGRGARAA